MNDENLIGRTIHRVRRQRGLSQEALAGLVEVTATYISKIENGHEKPANELLKRIGRVLQPSNPDFLLWLKDRDQAPLRIGVGHVLWSAPIIALASDPPPNVSVASTIKENGDPDLRTLKQIQSDQASTERADETALGHLMRQPVCTVTKLKAMLREDKLDCILIPERAVSSKTQDLKRCVKILDGIESVKSVLCLRRGEVADLLGEPVAAVRSDQFTDDQALDLWHAFRKQPRKRALRLLFPEDSGAEGVIDAIQEGTKGVFQREQSAHFSLLMEFLGRDEEGQREYSSDPEREGFCFVGWAPYSTWISEFIERKINPHATRSEDEFVVVQVPVEVPPTDEPPTLSMQLLFRSQDLASWCMSTELNELLERLQRLLVEGLPSGEAANAVSRYFGSSSHETRRDLKSMKFELEFSYEYFLAARDLILPS